MFWRCCIFPSICILLMSTFRIKNNVKVAKFEKLVAPCVKASGSPFKVIWIKTRFLSVFTSPKSEEKKVRDVSPDISRHNLPPLLCISVVCQHMTPGLSSTFAYTLIPWHVPLLANPPLTPLCGITLHNRTINDYPQGGQLALAASDRISHFATVEGHIGFLYNSVNT